jgi:ribosome biogenesis GTPase
MHDPLELKPRIALDARRDKEPPTRGVIVSHVGVAVDVDVEVNGPTGGAPVTERRRVRVARRSGHVVGDDVEVVGERLVRLPRRTELQRRSPSGGVHVVAANLNALGIVVAVDPPPKGGIVDRASVASRVAHIEPFLVVNKIDLDEDGEIVAEVMHQFEREMRVFPVSADTGEGIDALEAFLAGCGRACLIGSSGVGKSSLLNRLVPGAELAVRALSDATGAGRHTTTVSTLLRLPKGGELADTPGVREYGLVDVGPQELAHHFPGFEAALGKCRFRDCLHEDEPGCAVVDAVDEDAIPAERYVSYRTILVEAKENAAAAAPRRR